MRARPACAGFGLIRPIELREQRPEIRLVDAPAADRALIDRLPDLRGAGRAHRSLGPMEFEAARVPVEAAMRENAPRLTFQIRDHVFEPLPAGIPDMGELYDCVVVGGLPPMAAA